ncbi:MAG: Transporter, monovalent cation:proton antiporter-2 family [Alphaproteobacteria bacterium]|jgi:cell volume regulation protein A|nr:Transporter, monovalent cation:proton antiporter-2 family [Alphaproteobacteria bacterium]MDF3034024.1 Transporter, monovalent cation:proton antiporter-2 family [Alphaproteobacteria bacterium]
MDSHYSLDGWVLIISLLLLLAILASDLSKRLKIPAPLLFLVTGMLAGSDGIGGIYFDNVEVAQRIGIIALCFSLFSGGLDTQWRLVKPIFWPGLALSTVGVLVSTILVAGFAYYLLEFSLLEGLLLGAIISATDAAAIFSLFRSRYFLIKRELRMLVEFESGSNDPMAILLVFIILQMMQDPKFTPLSLSTMFLAQVIGGLTIGVLVGKLAVFLFRRMKLEYRELYPVFTIALVLLAYGAAAAIGGSGFLATYLLGIVIYQHDFHHKYNIKKFHAALTWLCEISMFLVLGLLVFPTQINEIFNLNLVVPFFLIFFARPVSVFVSLAFSGYPIKEKLLVSWLGLRGAVPIVLATFPMVMGIPKANTIFNLVFFVVLISFLIQGGLAPRLIKWLKIEH